MLLLISCEEADSDPVIELLFWPFRALICLNPLSISTLHFFKRPSCWKGLFLQPSCRESSPKRLKSVGCRPYDIAKAQRHLLGYIVTTSSSFI